jgi:hypothetical protein
MSARFENSTLEVSIRQGCMYVCAVHYEEKDIEDDEALGQAQAKPEYQMQMQTTA